MLKEKINFSVASLGKEEEEAVLRVLRSGWITTGKETMAFEKEFAQKINAKCALAVNSATSGLMLAYDALGLKDGYKILTTPYTFASTALAARHLGAHIEYADIEKDSYNISADAVEQKLEQDARNGKKIKAIVPVHIAGNVCNMDALKQLAEHYNVKIVEDAAHAFPSKTKNGFAGTLGDIGVFSFYATKTITTAEGGMITTNNEEYAKRMQVMRLHGIDRPIWDRYTKDKASWEYDVVDAGFKCNLPDILGAIGREQLKKADTLFEKRKRIVERYNNAFKNIDFLTVPPDGDGNAWHLYLLRIKPEMLKINRNEFGSLLQDEGICISMHFIPHFRMTYFKNEYGLKAEDFPNAQEHFEKTITLPLWPDMTDEMADRVIETVLSIGKAHHA
ncbi:MAG: DegT/DnrJ/EryC1/StrS family aminotransferase [Treponemataceae bacterium]|nr:DegT/DnrJ/EryC1/StrS family aminotransferase [Treponemataceae bacterium]